MAKMRKRLTLACDTCRSRRVKCDGQRPCCAPCRIRGLDCFYQQLPESPATKVETELANVNLRLDYLTALLSRQSRPLVESHAGLQEPTRALGSHEDSPFRLLATNSIMRVFGLDDNYAQRLLQLERANLLVGTTTHPRTAFIPHQQITDALAAFSDRIHSYYPILPLDFSERYFSTLSDSSLAPSCHTCLVLVVAALGCVAHNPTTGSHYFEAALASLPVILAECTVTSIQCLIFLSIYYCCILKPCQAHDYCLIAAFKIQNLFKSGLQNAENDSLELTHRAYWAILLLERQQSELSVQLDLAKSSIWSLDECIPLPNCQRTWQFPPPQTTSPAAVSPASIHSTDSTSTTADQARSFFLAEIAMRRMLQRCNSAVTRTADGRPSYAPGIALELERQLDEWYDYLPGNIRFAKEPGPSQPYAERIESLSNFLNVQYYCCKLSIYWPAAFQAIQDGGASIQLLDHVQRFIDAYVQLLPRITFAVNDCLVYKWTLSVSLFTTTMAALKVAEAPCFGGASRDQLRECLPSAAAVEWRGAEGSPSLEELRQTLRARLGEAGYKEVKT
ncbi:putative C6 transcription factor [Aspergillus novofumigatus IBT 16806]|uniref:Putative C6 transcription factor n=1 Tax=Aspergillus novofumigatus (strain IBT 16806) TaxID=1392255 RepID=A0A2I1BUG3_ASPN1|nr:putative C6 transcription factor [Aspergillus novofumigatus IBT 16806]PKX89038.1 putative C6 transcription factor [Aspergillus novofumigatus IBT 16806]